MACRAPMFPHALHPDILIVAQSGRALVRPAHRQEIAPRRAPIDSGPGEGHPRLDRGVERRPPPVCVDEDPRRDPRTPRLISSTNSRRRTLVVTYTGSNTPCE